MWEWEKGFPHQCIINKVKLAQGKWNTQTNNALNRLYFLKANFGLWQLAILSTLSFTATPKNTKKYERWKHCRNLLYSLLFDEIFKKFWRYKRFHPIHLNVWREPFQAFPVYVSAPAGIILWYRCCWPDLNGSDLTSKRAVYAIINLLPSSVGGASYTRSLDWHLSFWYRPNAFLTIVNRGH